MQRIRVPFRALAVVAFVLAPASAATAPAVAAPRVLPCTAALRSALNFWAGDWIVADTHTHARLGTNRIERVDGGFAYIERWRETGGEGVSLFYLDPRVCTWRQTWVTDRPELPGGLKQKELVARYPDGGLRFAGSYPGRRFPMVLDRTTLTPRHDGTLRQVIELSGDGGKTWITGFDAVYARR